MEEILASIRQIISEDGDKSEARASRSLRVAIEDDEAEPVASSPQPVSPQPVEAPAAAEAEAVSETSGAEEAADDDEDDFPDFSAPFETAVSVEPQSSQPEPAEEPEPVEEPKAAEPAMTEAVQPSFGHRAEPETFETARPAAKEPSSMTTYDARMRADDRLLSEDADEAVSGAFSSLAHTILSQNARTLEDLVSEMLRPMLKEWLDDNLPPLVERLVKEEIERVSRGRR
ncbi:cell pole-organizing protein PopZ [Rhodopseudomonas julia]|uniref:Cell pole-organizing protein PopZ n=1 Tax=Rhodopseudomonas julia TaxID=200617 RepID=A0ABU0CDB2_9BRAD|nr:DUF2497 domain-containing protein [Rhodopseudomonas julia]MDQ0327052.1 cell pole-organizing protein PopZ [Rhodopseudomonas julia]